MRNAASTFRVVAECLAHAGSATWHLEGLRQVRALGGKVSGSKCGFPKIRGTLVWGPSNKDPTILGSPISGNPQIIVARFTGFRGLESLVLTLVRSQVAQNSIKI